MQLDKLTVKSQEWRRRLVAGRWQQRHRCQYFGKGDEGVAFTLCDEGVAATGVAATSQP